MNFGTTDDLAAWAIQDLSFGHNVVLGVPSRDIGRTILDRVANQIGPARIRRKTGGSLETIDGTKAYYVVRGDVARGIQAKVYLHWEAPIDLDRALGPCEANYA